MLSLRRLVVVSCLSCPLSSCLCLPLHCPCPPYLHPCISRRHLLTNAWCLLLTACVQFFLFTVLNLPLCAGGPRCFGVASCSLACQCHYCLRALPSPLKLLPVLHCLPCPRRPPFFSVLLLSTLTGPAGQWRYGTGAWGAVRSRLAWTSHRAPNMERAQQHC